MITGYLYETHLHTSEVSACGKIRGADYVDYMISRGYNGMFVTDHFFNGNCAVDSRLDWKERVDGFACGYRNALEAAAGKDFDVLFGIEFNFDGDEYLIYGVDIGWIKDNDDITCVPRREVYHRVSQAKGIMIQAHPFRERSYLSDIKLTSDICDGIEVFNAGNTPNQNALALRYARKLGLPMTSGSDIHRQDDRAMGGMILPQRIREPGEYVDAVRSGEAVPVRVYNGTVTKVTEIAEFMTRPDDPSFPVHYM